MLLPTEVRKPWWVYIIETENRRLYTGISTDVDRRLRDHLSGKGARCLRGASQLTLMWQVELGSHSEALRVERRIKSLSARAKRELMATATGRDDLLSSVDA